MIAVWIARWESSPVMFLAMVYRPPMRAPRVAPPSLRDPAFDVDALTRLAAVVDRGSR